MNIESENRGTVDVKSSKHPVFEVTALSKYFALALFIAMPFIGGWVGYQSAPSKIAEVKEGIVKKTSTATVPNSLEKKYKKTFLEGDIPFDWSELSVSETIVKKGESLTFSSVRYSFSSEAIQFGDGAWEQVDFYYLGEGVAEELIATAKQEDGVQVNESTLGGTQTVVIQYPLDNDEVTKAGTGGTTYITAIPEDQRHHSSHPTHLLIRKWALGDEVFEENFRQYLDTADFTKLFNQ